MATLAGIPLCSRGVDLLIYGISAAVSLQAAAHLRHPDRLIPALPPQQPPSSAAGGASAAGQLDAQLDAAKPPAPIVDLVREALQSYGLPEAKVQSRVPERVARRGRGLCLALLPKLRLSAAPSWSHAGENRPDWWHGFQVCWVGFHR